MQKRIERAKELLRTIRHVPLATVNEDGSPHNTPVFAAFDVELNLYWSSHPASVHSQNIARDGKVFAVLFDSREGHGGLFMQATAKILEDSAAVKQAYELLREAKGSMYGTMGKLESYGCNGPQRIYKAIPGQLWINKSERDEHGAIVRDQRYEIAKADIVS